LIIGYLALLDAEKSNGVNLEIVSWLLDIKFMSKQNKVLSIAVVLIILIIGIGWMLNNKTVQKPLDNGQDNNYNVQPVKPLNVDDHLWGNAEAPVKIIVYSDFECPFCAAFHDTLQQVKDEFKDQVEIAFRHYPLASHPEALKAAEASECAAEQGKFWEMYNQLFIDNKAGIMTPDQFKKDAVDLGLDQAQFNQCLDTDKFKNKVTAQMLGGKNAGVNGTPTFFVNGQIYVGAYPFRDFTGNDGKPEKGLESIIKEILSKM